VDGPPNSALRSSAAAVAAADDAWLVPLTDLSQRPEQIPATAWYALADALADALAARPLG